MDLARDLAPAAPPALPDTRGERIDPSEGSSVRSSRSLLRDRAHAFDSGIHRRPSFVRTAFMNYEICGATSVGLRRKNNEDAYIADARLGLLAVADGMGGHAAGEVASALAVSSLVANVDRFASGHTEVPSSIPSQYSTPERNLIAAIRGANEAIREESAMNLRTRGMGTTIVALHATDEGVAIAHVGDSRAYCIRGTRIVQLTHDHSLYALLESTGALSNAAQATGEGKNVLLRALGIESDVAVDVQLLAPRAGDVFLLCSDGLHGLVDDPDIVRIVNEATTLEEAANALLATANARGGTDNITVVLARASEPVSER